MKEMVAVWWISHMLFPARYTSVTAAYVVPYGCTVGQDVHMHFLHKILRPLVRETHSQMFDYVIILHDNIHPCISISVNTDSQEYGWEVLKHSPYSPDLSPLDYNLLLKLKEPLYGIYFSDLSELSSAMTKKICGLTKTSSYME